MIQHSADIKFHGEIFLDSIIETEDYQTRKTLELILRHPGIGRRTFRRAHSPRTSKKYKSTLQHFFEEAERRRTVREGIEKQRFFEYFSRDTVKQEVLKLSLAYLATSILKGDYRHEMELVPHKSKTKPYSFEVKFGGRYTSYCYAFGHAVESVLHQNKNLLEKVHTLSKILPKYKGRHIWDEPNPITGRQLGHRSYEVIHIYLAPAILNNYCLERERSR